MTATAPRNPLARSTSTTWPPMRRMPLAPRRIEMWSTPGPGGAAAARVLYRARRRRARIARAAVTRVLPRRIGRALPVPIVESVVSAIAAETGVHPEAAAALHARETLRWMFALTDSDGRGIVIKLGMVDDDGLAREAAAMAEFGADDFAIQIPNVRWLGEHKGWFAIATDIADRRSNGTEPNLEDARTAACALATTKRGFVVHGDFAPWNIVPTAKGLVLVDWEDCRFAVDPLYDLSHFVTRAGALLRAWRPETAVQHLTGPGSVGWRYMEEIGLDPKRAPDLLVRYLQRAEPKSPVVRRYQTAMANELTARRTLGR
jgi:Phosphotransferase enzyme family